jgi:methyl-accepting chemotaxis protein
MESYFQVLLGQAGTKAVIEVSDTVDPVPVISVPSPTSFINSGITGFIFVVLFYFVKPVAENLILAFSDKAKKRKAQEDKILDFQAKQIESLQQPFGEQQRFMQQFMLDQQKQMNQVIQEKNNQTDEDFIEALNQLSKSFVSISQSIQQQTEDLKATIREIKECSDFQAIKKSDQVGLNQTGFLNK